MKLIAALQLLLPGMPMIYYGDEYAMDGGQDPDCRRGMVWAEDRQDADMYAWYRQLLRVRREHPELLARDVQDVTDDERGLLIRRAGEYTLVFHCKDGAVNLPEYAGRQELLTNQACGGAFTTFGAWVLLEI